MTSLFPKLGKLSARSQGVIAVAVFSLATGAIVTISKANRGDATTSPGPARVVRGQNGEFHPTALQWEMLTVQPVETQQFRTEFVTEGKVAVDEDWVSRIFSPYAGRVTKILAAPGDTVERGQPLFIVEAADSVQAQNDFIAAVAALNKARSQVNLTQIIERRMANLSKDKVIALKDWQEAQANLVSAQNDLRSAEIGLEAVRNRMRLLGKTDVEIDKFEKTGAITPDALVRAPISGTILQRKVGPGQYINAGASDSDPVFLIGDTSKIWLIAYVRESDAPKVKLGESIRFTVLAYPERVFEAKLNYVATSVDPNTRRLTVRATVDNSSGLLKPEMFANVTIVTDEGLPTAAVPRDAIVYEGDAARVWAVRDGDVVELRRIKVGLTNGEMVQVLEGLKPGEKVITKGSLFIDRAAAIGS